MKILKQSKGFNSLNFSKTNDNPENARSYFIQDTSLEQGNRIERILKDIQ